MSPDTYPHNLDAERALLGGVLADPRQLGAVAEVVTGADWYRPEHAALWALLVAMDTQGQTIDLVTLPRRLQGPGLPSVGYVLELDAAVPSVANLDHYAHEVRRTAVLRRAMAAADRLRRDAQVPAADPHAVLDEAAGAIAALSMREGAQGWSHVGEVARHELDRITEVCANQGQLTGAPTGLADLDRELTGLHAPDLVILAARPGMGKTALALGMATAVAERGKAVGVFSLEMSRGQLTTRLLCSLSGVASDLVRRGDLTSRDWDRLLEAQGLLETLPLYLEDDASLSMVELRARARRLQARHPDLGLIVVDYLQLMQGERGQSRVNQVSAISRGLKLLAKDLDVPVVCLSQLNRGCESREDKRPRISDLRESGAIEQDADVVMFIYRDDYYDEHSPDRGLAEVIIAKQRNGPTGTVRVQWDGARTRFLDSGAA